jgi:hypothetical protein
MCFNSWQKISVLKLASTRYIYMLDKILDIFIYNIESVDK